MSSKILCIFNVFKTEYVQIIVRWFAERPVSKNHISILNTTFLNVVVLSLDVIRR